MKFRLLAIALTTCWIATAAEPTNFTPLFDRIKALSGEWTGRSSQGWEGDSTFEVIANGSAVMHVSHMKEHAGQTMTTLFHRNGGELMLTHYCMAGNQPRLKAIEYSADGRTAVFDFVDATNLRTPGSGHMHRVKYDFKDANHYVSQWTWKQDGQERIMETIEYTRKK